ncbi:non-specific lipid transfer protein GPI-anchored 30-like [Lycium ferocissimum]|uniref:non-specific lipid transfer protein GPI-anchored 30-like n=1 Tax=Lycium ferocissimum TaxID=112874 RepID=UPI0028151A83|nr:non-specific lipid transfer protein GPI-anchored 30-like [Lycium ferocissimum]
MEIMNKFMMMIIILLSGLIVQQALAQNRNCINSLFPCMNFLNGSRGDPPESCCNPLKDMIHNMPECLCQMVSIKGSNVAEQSGINMNEAQMLPAKCGQPVNYMGCLKGASNSDSNSAGYSIRTSSMTILMAVASLIFAQVL